MSAGGAVIMSENYVINGGTLTAILDHVTEVQGALAPPPPLQSDYLVPGKNAAVAARCGPARR